MSLLSRRLDLLQLRFIVLERVLVLLIKKAFLLSAAFVVKFFIHIVVVAFEVHYLIVVYLVRNLNLNWAAYSSLLLFLLIGLLNQSFKRVLMLSKLVLIAVWI